MKTKMSAIAVAAICMATLASPAYANDEVALDAVTAVAPELVDAAATLPQASEGNVIAGNVGPVGFEVSSAAVGGVTVQAGESINIGLPFAAEADNAVVEQPGIVSYDNNNGSTTIPIVRADGSIQINTVIDGPEAPQSYEYQLSLPAGYSLAADGTGAVVLNAEGEVAGRFAAPWALDANGTEVPTRYMVDGASLVQVVDHGEGVAYPVVADPTYVGTTVYYTVAEVRTMYRAINNIDNFCRFAPTNYLAGIGCGAPPALANAVTQAYFQGKRVRGVYNNCGFNYCNTFTYSVVA